MRQDNARQLMLINAANLTGAGARAIGLSLIPELVRCHPRWDFCLLVPDDPAFRSLALPENAELLFEKGRTGPGREIFRLWELFWRIPKLAEKKQAAVCLTLGDINPAGLPCPGAVFVQQALLAYEPRELLGAQTWSRGKQIFLQKLFSLTAKPAAAVIVQSEVMARRLRQKYRIPSGKIRVIRQPVPQALKAAALTAAPNPEMSGCSKNVKLLFLARGYPHKNHAILTPVVRELRRRGLAGQVQIFTTIDQEAEAGLAGEVLKDNGDVVTNLGLLSAPEAAGAFKAASALFLPTLIESYGLIYLEAMTFGLPVLTSDRDFAREMCRGQALYFDPHSAASIADAIQKLPAFSQELQAGKNIAAEAGRFPADWEQAARQFMEAIETTTTGKDAGQPL